MNTGHDRRPSRRHVLAIGGAAVAALPFGIAPALADESIVMRGDTFGADVWFDPVGLMVRPGTTVSWRNDDPVNAHTATAYHPANRGRPLRIPVDADPWDSDYLLPGDRFSVTLTIPGVYDYYCTPHEAAGMRGRIVVAGPGLAPPAPPPDGDPNLPAVDLIIERGAIYRATDGGDGGRHQP